jgi:hypothetical protein
MKRIYRLCVYCKECRKLPMQFTRNFLSMCSICDQLSKKMSTQMERTVQNKRKQEDQPKEEKYAGVVTR